MTRSPSPLLDDLAASLGRRLPGRVERDAPSAGLVTYRCGGPFAILARASSEADLLGVAESLADAPEVPLLVVGRGSNLLVADTGFEGVAVVLDVGLEHVDVDATGCGIRAGGAAALPVLARRAAASGLAGLEFYVGIPGSVGGAVRMNAGGHGRETRDVLTEVRVVDLSNAVAGDRSAADLDLGYRTSVLTDGEVVVEARFAAERGDPAECARRIEEVVRWRRVHQPGGANAGSVFRNPPDDSAGRLIDSCGLKGRTVGGVRVSEKHANFFVAGPGATATDVRDLVSVVRSEVEAATGVRLECELRMVGLDDGSGSPR